MSKPNDKNMKTRRLHAVAKLRQAKNWLVRYKLRMGAVLLGLGAILGYVLSADQITLKVIVWGAVLGGLASIPAIIFEEAIRSRARQESTPVAKPTGQQHAGSLEPARTEPAAPALKGNDSRFQGRQAEIDTLLGLHRRQVLARSGTDSGVAVGPVVLAIHGMPRVGKSMLARQVGSLLAGEYPDGRLSENFGSAGGPAPPAEILKRFLVKLGRPENEIPDDVDEQANLFRSMTTGKKILFEFDAARNPDQVLQVLPTEPECAVIITSRRDLTAQLNVPRGVALGPPQLHDALEILTAVSGFDWMLQAEHAVEVVELCGRLPGAIVAAAERVLQDGTDLRHVAEALQRPTDRLAKLDYNGRGVRERYMSEYRRLLPRQQEALCLLTLVESPTFIPWVLSPLLQVGREEAENVMAALGDAQLLENAGPHEATGRARYRFNPLVKLFAKEQLGNLAESAVEAAREAFDTQYLALVDEGLAQLYPDYRRIAEQPVPASIATVALLIAEQPELYTRREYQSLLRLIAVALHRGHFELAWRVAALLKGCVPMGEQAPDPRDTFESAIEAARTDGSVLARTDVELALGYYLVAVENYPRAFRTLANVIERLRREPAASSPEAEEHSRRVVRAQRGIAEAFVQMGDYRNAEAWLEAAAETAQDVGSEDEKDLVSLLTADAYRIPDGEAIYEHLVDGHHVDDLVSFRALLGHSEDYRRRGQWSQARRDLMAAAEHSSGDARRMASVHYRLARLHIDQWRSSQPGQGFPPERGSAPAEVPEPASGLRELPRMAVREAATSALLFRQMNNLQGVIRARCILARALLTAGKPLAAERLLRTVRQSLSLSQINRNPAYSGLLARYTRAYGELQLHRHILGSAWRNLCHAASRFESSNDFSSNEEIWQLLEAISNSRPYPSDADLPDLSILEFPHEIEQLPEVEVQLAYGIPRPRSPRAGRESTPPSMG